MNTLKDELQKRAYIKPDSKYLNQIEQYIISLLIAGFIYEIKILNSHFFIFIPIWTCSAVHKCTYEPKR